VSCVFCEILAGRLEASFVHRDGRRVVAALRVSGVRCEGVNLHLADGEVAGQDLPPRAELDAAAADIGAALLGP